jgi:hypothetical protein
MIAPESLYPAPTNPECLIILYDLREPDGAAALQRQRHALLGYTNVEKLDEHCVALIVHPGWLLGSAR